VNYLLTFAISFGIGVAFFFFTIDPVDWAAILGKSIGFSIVMMIFELIRSHKKVKNPITPQPEISSVISNNNIVTKEKDKKVEDTGILKQKAQETIDSPDFYLQAWEEIETNATDKGLWAKSFALTDGDKEKAKASYLKVRARELEESFLENKKNQEELRRLAAIKAEQSRPENMARRGIIVSSVKKTRNIENESLISGDIIINYNGVDVRGNKEAFFRLYPDFPTAELQ